MTEHNRRTILRLLATGTGVSLGGVGSALASQSAGGHDELRLFSEVGVAGANEVVDDGNYVYVATGGGMSVVDWRNPGRPEVVAEVDLVSDLQANLGIENPVVDILDLKVDDGVAALANNGSENPGGISLYDVSDPTNPQFLAQYEPTFDGPGPSPGADIHNCYLEDGYAYLTLAEPWSVDDDGDGERERYWLFGNTGVEIVDIRDPANPQQAARWLLKDDEPEVAKASRVPCHDVYVQDGVCYAALWDAGTAALDVSDPTNPTLVSRFGSDVDASDAIPAFEIGVDDFNTYLFEQFDFAAYLTAPGNAHYVQPSTDGNYVFVGAETFPKDVGISNPGVDDYGGIEVWDTSDLSNPQFVTRIDPPVIDDDQSGKLFTSHNFDVTANRLHTSWYHGGVHVYDITDPTTPEHLAGYDPDGYAFWTAVSGRGFTVGGVYGAASANAGGVTILNNDRGAKQPPAFDGSNPSGQPDVVPDANRE
ncbi:LVIVD repeat-containing protein [Haloferax sp. YSMS24]|uniref:LVIVD repeat-containing protein n=1 Tax=Haloferax sp. YSMS24 TaxID=3388425 RepID=UPI00398CEF29